MGSENLGEVLFFWLFALATCGGAVAVVISQSVVRMAFWLIVSLGSVAGLFFLLNADFVGATQLLIYVGGTIVLLVFGLMLTASGPYLRIDTSPGEGFLAGGVGLLLLSLLVWTIFSTGWIESDPDTRAYDANVAGHSARPLGAALLGLRPRTSGAHAETLLLSAPALATGKDATAHKGTQTIKLSSPLSADATKSLAEQTAIIRLFLPQGRISSQIQAVDAAAGELTVSHTFKSEVAIPRYEIVAAGAVLIDFPNVLELPAAITESVLDNVPVDGSAMVQIMTAQGHSTARITGFDVATRYLQLDRALETPSSDEAATEDSQPVDFDIIRLGTGYLLPFEVVSIHLLVVLIGAAYLARAKRRVGSEGSA